MSFEEKLGFGKIGENIIVKWFLSKGYAVLPAYDIVGSEWKGPRIFTATGNLVSPDMLVFSPEKIVWIEAKTKSAFTWHRRSKTWQTGIDRHHWQDYQKVRRLADWETWLLFCHLPGKQAKDTPSGKKSPAGLFAGEIGLLAGNIDHESDKWGRHGMVYWRIDAFTRLATAEELNSLEPRKTFLDL